jgi:hypothetical protein
MDSMCCQADSMTEPLVNLRESPPPSAGAPDRVCADRRRSDGLLRLRANTEDLDVVVASEQENLDRVTDWLISLDAVLKLNPERRFRARVRWTLHKGSNATVLTSLGQVDVMQQLPGLPDWPTLLREAEVYEVEGQTVRVMSRSTWADLKRRRGSPQDLADIDAIERSLARLASASARSGCSRYENATP